MTGCEALAGAALVMCLARAPGCLPPDVGFRADGRPSERLRRLAATVEVESGPRGPWAIRNETTKRSAWYPTRAEAEREAMRLHARGDVLGLGLAQITGVANWRVFGLADAQGRPVYAFDPCRNLRAAVAHQRADEERAYRLAAFRQFNGGPRALEPGVVPAADAYALRVDAAMQRLPAEPAPLPSPAGPNPCAGAPTPLDAFATARFAATCGRRPLRTLIATATQGR